MHMHRITPMSKHWEQQRQFHAKEDHRPILENAVSYEGVPSAMWNAYAPSHPNAKHRHQHVHRHV